MIVLFPLALAALLSAPPAADARPEFARREGRGCGYCHINPRGGGPRNQRGLAYARNEFKFPPRKGDLTVFTRESDKNRMILANRLIDLDHVKAAVRELKKLAKGAKGEPARKAARDELHELDVRGNEVLGQARRMLRGDDVPQGVELLQMLATEYRDLDVYEQVNGDLKDLRSQKELRDLIQKERQEAKARLAFLDGLRWQQEEHAAKAQKAFAAILKNYAGTRAAKAAQKYVPKGE